jgi:hypothetical protein
MHQPFASIATILTGFHSASLRHAFTSVAFSPPAAHYFARRLSPLRLRSACIRTAHSLRPFRLRLLGFTCIVQPPPYPVGKYTPAASYVAGIAIRSSWLYCQPLVGARSHLRSFLSSVAYGGSPPALQPRRFAGRLCFFFAAGAFTGRLDTLPLLLRKHY